MSSTEQQRPPPKVSADTMKKIMWLYRTRTCPLNKRGQCNYGDRCFDSHSVHPERRAPKQNEYNDWHPSTMKCTSNADESCKYGRACYFAHNDVEVNYHPTMYKTTLCSDFEKDGVCKLGMICPFYHYPEEQRKIEKETLSTDCKSDNVSRKAPPPQEFRRWLDGELKRCNIDSNSLKAQESVQQINGNGNKQHIKSSNLQSITNANIHSKQQLNDKSQLKQQQRIENEVEIQLPSNHQHDNNLMLRNVSDSMSPFVVEHIDEKWHQGYNNQSRAEQYLPSTSPHLNHLNRAMSTPSSIPSVPSTQMMPLANVQMADSMPSASSRIVQSHSNASFRSGRSQKSNSSKKKKSKKKSKKSRSVHSGQSLGSIHGHSHRSNNSKRAELQKLAIDIVKTYKVTRCPKSKCVDPYCPNYHNWEDRRRSPFSFGYSEHPCARIFDAKTKKFTDNCYGCPMNEACEFAHNYLEIWYHPNIFHTKQCPLVKYQKNCPWGFKCSHYHKRSQKQRKAVMLSQANIAQNSGHHGAPPNLQQHIVGQQVGPHRPPLTHRAKQSPSMMSSEIGSPYSAVSSFDDGSNANGQSNGQSQQQQRNGLMSPHFNQHSLQQHENNGANNNKSSPHDSSYSFNPLMQGIAPSINSWRQKIDSNSGY